MDPVAVLIVGVASVVLKGLGSAFVGIILVRSVSSVLYIWASEGLKIF